MSKLPRPTDAELVILRVLWAHGPSTVRGIKNVLDPDRPTRYTTVLKMLQIMTGKGLVWRKDVGRIHVYRAQLSETRTQRQLLRDLLERAFGGSSSKLVMQALATTGSSAKDMREVERLLQRSGKTKRDA